MGSFNSGPDIFPRSNLDRHYDQPDVTDEQWDGSGSNLPVSTPLPTFGTTKPLEQYDTDMSDEQWSNS